LYEIPVVRLSVCLFILLSAKTVFLRAMITYGRMLDKNIHVGTWK